MNRLVGHHEGLISAAWDLIPERLRPLCTADLFVGADPVFAGLYRWLSETAPDGRSFRDTWHVGYPWHNPDRRTTIFIPKVRGRYAVAGLVHEFGHVLDESLGFSETFRPVTKYAETNRGEAFAEAFTAWVGPPGYEITRPWLEETAPEAVALFEALAV